MRTAAVARPHEQLRVRAHERHRHRHLNPVGQQRAELLDRAEDVVPPAGVQRTAVVAQLVQDLLRLERREDRLDQHGAPHGAGRQVERLLGECEGVRPEPRLQVALELRQVEVRTAAALEQLVRVVEHHETEVEEARGRFLSVDANVALGQVPSARTKDEGRNVVVQAIALLGRVERDRPANRVADVLLPDDHVLPGRRARVLEVRHEHAGTRVERVDHHLALDRPGDLATAIEQIGRCGRDAPVALPNRAGRVEEAGPLAGREPLGALMARREQLTPARVELPVQQLDELERAGRENRFVGGREKLDARQRLPVSRRGGHSFE